MFSRTHSFGDILDPRPFVSFDNLERELADLTANDGFEHIYITDEKIFGRVNAGEFTGTLFLSPVALSKTVESLERRTVFIYHSHAGKEGSYDPPSADDLKFYEELLVLSQGKTVRARVLEPKGVWEYRTGNVSIGPIFRRIDAGLRRALELPIDEQVESLNRVYRSAGCDILFRES